MKINSKDKIEDTLYDRIKKRALNSRLVVAILVVIIILANIEFILKVKASIFPPPEPQVTISELVLHSNSDYLTQVVRGLAAPFIRKLNKEETVFVPKSSKSKILILEIDVYNPKDEPVKLDWLDFYIDSHFGPTGGRGITIADKIIPDILKSDKNRYELANTYPIRLNGEIVQISKEHFIIPIMIDFTKVKLRTSKKNVVADFATPGELFRISIRVKIIKEHADFIYSQSILIVPKSTLAGTFYILGLPGFRYSKEIPIDNWHP